MGEGAVTAEKIYLFGGLFIAVITIAFIIVVAILLKGKHRLETESAKKARCIQIQTKQYHLMNEKQLQLRAFRHDMNNHLLALSRLAGNDDLEGVKRYLCTLQNIYDEVSFISTGNVICDAILNSYYRQGQETKVSVEVLGKFEEGVEIPETDLCVILANTVGNAYEAAAQCEGLRYVIMEIGQYEGISFITITNSTKEMPEIVDGIMKTTKSDKDNHGFGIANTLDAIQRNGGSIQWDYEEGKVVTKITI
jgi:sensor histidine kinase regulating citrate/malate metabolism